VSADPTTWRTVRVEGAFTVVEVPTEPGRVAEIPIRTDLLNTPAAVAMVQAILDRHDTTKDQLRESP